jgi:hypothetical protein
VDQTVTGPGSAMVTHDYGAAGYTCLAVTATDPNGLSSTAYQYVNTLPVFVAIQTDPAQTSQQMLVLTGSPYSDSIVLGMGANNNGLTLTFDG